MNVRYKFNTKYQLVMALDALHDAWQNNCCFTLQSFCKKYADYPPNRHTVNVMNILVAGGWLYTFIGRDDRNRRVRYWCAQKTENMVAFKDGLGTEDSVKPKRER